MRLLTNFTVTQLRGFDKHVLGVIHGLLPFRTSLIALTIGQKMVKVRLGISTSKKEIKNLAKKLKCNHGRSAIWQEAQYELEMAKLDQKNAKATAPYWREEYNSSLALSKAKEQRTSLSCVYANMRQVQRQ